MKNIFIIVFSLFFSVSFAQEKTRIYLANDDHTDFIWSAGTETYHKAFLETLDYYINLADETDCDSSQFQSRWNCDGSYWMWMYEKNRSQEQFNRLISRIHDGHISVPLNALSVSLGSTPAEGVIRGMYYPGKIERKYKVAFPLAYQVENQTLAYGLGSLWAGSGAKYSWVGICGCDTRVKNLNNRENYIYWWLGADSSKILMKWYPLIDLNDNQSVGGYAEARHTWVPSVVDKFTLSKPYPYTIIGLFGKGWDDLETLTREVITTAKIYAYENKKVMVSNEIDFFEDFEKNYGNKIPYQSYSFGNEWEVYTAYLQEVTSGMLRSIEKLRSAEALATMVSLHDNTFMDKYGALRDSAWMSIGLFWDHDWGTVDRNCFADERIQWQKHLGEQVKKYVNNLFDDANKELGNLIAKNAKNKRFYVFNPLSKERTDIADFSYSGKLPVSVTDISTGESVPSDLIQVNGETKIRILAKRIPSVGYKVYEIQPGKVKSFKSAGSYGNSKLENPFYIITIKENGAIASIIDKQNHNRELVKAVNGRLLNDLGKSTGEITLENSGYNSITVKVTAGSPLAHNSYITLYHDIPRIDIRNEITQNFEGTYNWSFGFNIPNPQVWHEEVGAIIKADYPQNGGYYSPRNGRYDWLTLSHFADMSNEDSGITISSPDCNFMQLGNSTYDSIDTKTPQIKILAGADTIAGSYSRPFLRKQGGESFFLQRFALYPHNNFNKLQSMQFALEHQNPLICGEITGGNVYPETTFSLIQIDNPNVLLWALKPAEDGIKDGGVVLRCWNISGLNEKFIISSSRTMSDAKRLTHIETPLNKIEIQGNRLNSNAKSQQIITLSVQLK
jgi:alpha-mannosidase